MNNITISEKQYNYLEDVVYNGLIPMSVISGVGGEGDYYSKTQLDAGQLDNRYYTETEITTNHYTKAQLNAGQLNNLYYTETEIDTWRNSVSQEEMGWLHGITSDVQTQISARAIIGANPANDRLCTWLNATTIQGEANLTFDGVTLTAPKMAISDTDCRLTMTDTSEGDVFRFQNQNGVFKIINQTDADREDMVIDGAGQVGINCAPSYKLDVNGTGRYTGILHSNTHIYLGGNIIGQHAGYLDLYTNTSDGSDTKTTRIGGGGDVATSRGAFASFYGNEHASYPGDMFLQSGATGEVYIKRSGITKLETAADGINIPENIGTDNYLSETTGWEGTYAGAFDFRSVYTDEMICKTFIADIDLALLSGTMVSKSITQVSRNFTVPANTLTGTLYVEAIPGFPTSQAFEAGDWIRLQVINRTGGGLTWLKVYGTVTNFVDDGGGEQHYTFTTQYDGLSHGAIGETVYAGAGAQDLGVSGNGFIQSEAGSHSLNTPYIQTATWVTNPYEGANITVRNRLGNLAGITGQSGFGLVTRKDNTNYVSQFWNTDSDWGIKGMVGGSTMFQLGDENVIAGFTIHATDGLYAGSGATRVQMKPGAGFWTGATAIGDAPFSVTNAGVLDAVSGTIGAWTLATDALYTGTKHTADDWSTTGTTFASNGGIHTPDFYVNSDGSMGIRQCEYSEFYLTGAGVGLKIHGNEIWENKRNNNDGVLYINWNGYDSGITVFRSTIIGDGKNTPLAEFNGSEDKVKIYAMTFEAHEAALFKKGASFEKATASGYAGYFFNDGGFTNRWGIGIQCGEDVPSTYNYPVKFFDGDGGPVSNINYDNTSIQFAAISDIRLKENIKDYDFNGLDIVNQMQYRSFNWKKDKDKHEAHGWIADEVEKIYPDMVLTDDETGYKMIMREKLIPVMMSAIKELNEKVKVLELK